MSDDIEQAVNSLREAVEIRKQISLLYKDYKKLSLLASEVAGIEHHDFKRAVDAIYYFGGGWPHENSKGRLESLLDNFISVYRLLSFIGKENIITDYLKNKGLYMVPHHSFFIKERALTESEIEKTSGLEEKTNTALVESLIDKAIDLQGTICSLADQCKDIRDAVKEDLEIDDPESDRLFSLSRTSVKKQDHISKKKVAINKSLATYHKVSNLF